METLYEGVPIQTGSGGLGVKDLTQSIHWEMGSIYL